MHKPVAVRAVKRNDTVIVICSVVRKNVAVILRHKPVCKVRDGQFVLPAVVDPGSVQTGGFKDVVPKEIFKPYARYLFHDLGQYAVAGVGVIKLFAGSELRPFSAFAKEADHNIVARDRVFPDRGLFNPFHIVG